MAETTTGIPTIGEVVRAWRIFRGLTITKLAEKAGVRSQYLSEIEHDRTAHPREEKLQKLAVALEVPLWAIQARRLSPDRSNAAGALSLTQPAAGQPTHNDSVPSTLLQAPLSISDQEILMYRLAVLERKLAAATKYLQEASDELRELHLLAAQRQNPEEGHDPSSATSGV